MGALAMMGHPAPQVTFGVYKEGPSTGARSMFPGVCLLSVVFPFFCHARGGSIEAQPPAAAEKQPTPDEWRTAPVALGSSGPQPPGHAGRHRGSRA